MSVSNDSQNSSPQTHEPVVPADLTRGSYHSDMTAPQPHATVQETRSSSDSGVSSLKSPRTARFAEATTVCSPVERLAGDPPKTKVGDVGDVGFGYVAHNDPVQPAAASAPPVSPLKSAMKVPGTPGRNLNLLSPTFREEYMLDKQEKYTEKENARDLRIKLRVRIAKIFLRFVNFGCSLIVLALLAVTLSIFNATRHLPTRSSLPAWAAGTNPWAQYLLLGMSGVSLIACLAVFWGYYKGGHKRAQKNAVYYSVFSIVFFFFSMIMWVVGAAIYQNSKTTGNGKDLWGWSCAHNNREIIYQNTINYALVCRLQDWGLVCAVIEIVIEILAILIYAVVLYRIWSKRRLMKSMNKRDRARSELYLAQLHLQSAPNTPGFPLYSPYPPKSPFVVAAPFDPYSSAEKGENNDSSTQYASPRSPTRPAPTFQLQAPPIRTQQSPPQTAQEQFPAPAMTPSSPPPQQSDPQHMSAAPGERTYGSVPIPGAYSNPMTHQ